MHLGAIYVADTVISLGSVRETARRLSLSASTVSGIIRRLETELAIKLAERSAGELVTLLASARIQKGLQPMLAQMRILAGLTADPPSPEAFPLWASRLSLKIATIERFLEVVDQGSINRAARRLRLGQPQLSLQIANLEELIGCRLFERQAQGSVLTETGRRVHGVLLSIAAAWSEMKAAADERFQRSARTVRIGSIIPTGPESWVARCLGTVVARWSESGNRHALSLVLMTADDLREALRSARLDIAIVDSVFGLESFAHQELLATRMVAIAPPDSEETDITALLARHPLCLPSPRTGIGHAALGLGGGRHRPQGIRSRDITSVDSLPVIVDLVSHHGYVSFLGHVSAIPLQGRVRIIELGETVPLSYHVAYNDRQASIDACGLIAQVLAEIIAEDTLS